MPHTIRAQYTHCEVRTEHQGDPESDVYFAVYDPGGRIRALRLRRKYNPDICADPAEVWVAKGKHRDPWGDELARNTAVVHLYVAESDTDDAYTYRGVYRVAGSTAERKKLGAAEARLAQADPEGKFEPLATIVRLSGPIAQ